MPPPGGIRRSGDLVGGDGGCSGRGEGSSESVSDLSV